MNNDMYKYKYPTNNVSDFDSSFRVTHPADKIVVPEHIIVIDSRERDCCKYISPSFYKITLPNVYKNVTSIELKGSVIPRSSYNVHSTNKYIDFSIGSTITEIKLINGGGGYTTVPTVTIANPPNSGTLATATATILNGVVQSITITGAGSGYLASEPPSVIIQAPLSGSPAFAKAVVGTHYTAVLREGQYVIGGNPSPASNPASGLILEIQNAMNYAVNGGAYDPSSTSPFEVRLVNQYPTLDAVAGTPEYYNTNSCEFNRIQINNVNLDHWELLMCSGVNNKKSASNVLGFNYVDYSDPTTISAVSTGGFTLLSAGTSIRATNDYNLLDDPKYVILSFYGNDESYERIDSTNQSLNKKFGTIVFDANAPNVLTDTSGTSFTDGTSTYLLGDLTKGTYWKEPGILKPVRGFDLDQKRFELAAAIGKMSELTIEFTKFTSNMNGKQEYYDFCGRDHLLIFSIRCNDNQSGQKS